MKEYYVYGWFYKDNGQCFYIGKGCGNRYKDITNRSAVFKMLINKFPVESKILVSDLTEKESFQVEREIILTMIENRQPLVNNKFGEASTAAIDGIISAREKGAVWGRPKATYADNWETIYWTYRSKEITLDEALAKLEISKTTFYKLAKQYIMSEQSEYTPTEPEKRIARKTIKKKTEITQEMIDSALSKVMNLI